MNRPHRQNNIMESNKQKLRLSPSAHTYTWIVRAHASRISQRPPVPIAPPYAPCDQSAYVCAAWFWKWLLPIGIGVTATLPMCTPPEMHPHCHLHSPIPSTRHHPLQSTSSSTSITSSHRQLLIHTKSPKSKLMEKLGQSTYFNTPLSHVAW